MGNEATFKVTTTDGALVSAAQAETDVQDRNERASQLGVKARYEAAPLGA